MIHLYLNEVETESWWKVVHLVICIVPRAPLCSGAGQDRTTQLVNLLH